MGVKLYISLSLLFLNNYFIFTKALECRNEFNQPVDWYVVYKLPKIKHADKLIEDGIGYVYITSNHTGWTLSNQSINDSTSMVGHTLSALYKNMNNFLYVLYNDQPPDNRRINPNKGHTKGVIMADPNGGFWLIHSVPLFPQLGPKYEFSKNGFTNGQSFLCISMDLKQLDKVGVPLQYNEAQIYTSNVPSSMKAKMKQIAAAVAGATVTESYNIRTIKSQKGVNFKCFAKSKKFNKELYVDLVAPKLNSNLYVETWQNGAGGKLPSDCSKPFKVYNIQKVTMAVAKVTFRNTVDHSKWAVTPNSSWICIGDINRMEHQRLRGGGTVCLYNNTLANAYKAWDIEIEECKN